MFFICLFSLDHSLISGNCSHGELRLVGGADPSEGRLEVCINNAWGSVCDGQFDDEDASVACLQLGGFTRSGKYTHLCMHAVPKQLLFLKRDLHRVY